MKSSRSRRKLLLIPALAMFLALGRTGIAADPGYTDTDPTDSLPILVQCRGGRSTRVTIRSLGEGLEAALTSQSPDGPSTVTTRNYHVTRESGPNGSTVYKGAGFALIIARGSSADGHPAMISASWFNLRHQSIYCSVRAE